MKPSRENAGSDDIATLSLTELDSTRPVSLRSSVTRAIPASMASDGRSMLRGLPSISTLPLSGVAMPNRQLKNSLRPEPIRP